MELCDASAFESRQRGVITPATHTFQPGDAGAAAFVLTVPSNNAVLGDNVIEIFHVVVGKEDEPGYRDLDATTAEGGALPIEVLESDIPGFQLGNGAAGTILLEEPMDKNSPPVAASLGVTLMTRPVGSDVEMFFEEADPEDDEVRRSRLTPPSG